MPLPCCEGTEVPEEKTRSKGPAGDLFRLAFADLLLVRLACRLNQKPVEYNTRLQKPVEQKQSAKPSKQIAGRPLGPPSAPPATSVPSNRAEASEGKGGTGASAKLWRELVMFDEASMLSPGTVWWEAPVSELGCHDGDDGGFLDW
nr:hypothetical protein Iba_chr01aCG3540 [Ipomoea batatas]